MMLDKTRRFPAGLLLAAIVVLCAAPTVRLVGQTIDIHEGPASDGDVARTANRMARHLNFAGFDDPKLTLQDALDSLSETYHVSLLVRERAFTQEGCPADELLKRPIALTPLPAMRDVPVAAVVRAVLERAAPATGAVYLIRGFHVEITTPRQALKEARDGLGDGLSQYLDNLALSDWKEFDRYGIETMRFLGQINHWNGMMNESTKAILATKPQPRNVP